MEQQLSDILNTDDLVCMVLLAHTDFTGVEDAANYFWDTDENGHRIHKFIKRDQLCFLCSLPFEDHRDFWNGQLIEDNEVPPEPAPLLNRLSSFKEQQQRTSLIANRIAP